MQFSFGVRCHMYPHIGCAAEEIFLIIKSLGSDESQHIHLAVQDIDTSKLQALIAPAILRRSFLSLQILQFIQSFKAQVPVRSQGRQTVGGLYYLSYIDGNMLLGRAERGGAFVFARTLPFL